MVRCLHGFSLPFSLAGLVAAVLVPVIGVFVLVVIAAVAVLLVVGIDSCRIS